MKLSLSNLIIPSFIKQIKDLKARCGIKYSSLRILFLNQGDSLLFSTFFAFVVYDYRWIYRFIHDISQYDVVFDHIILRKVITMKLFTLKLVVGYVLAAFPNAYSNLNLHVSLI